MKRNINPNLLHVDTTPANNSLTSINNSFLHETYQSYMETSVPLCFLCGEWKSAALMMLCDC